MLPEPRLSSARSEGWLTEARGGRSSAWSPPRRNAPLLARWPSRRRPSRTYTCNGSLEIGDADSPIAAVVAAVARALRHAPRLNGAYRDGAFETYSRINVGVVADEADGLVVPTIFDADLK